MSKTATRSNTTRVYIARLAGTPVFDPVGDSVGHVHDVVVVTPLRAPARAVGLVVRVSGKKRIFLPITRVTSIRPGAVITTGIVNLRRFSVRASETLVLSQLLDRRVKLRDGSGQVEIKDAAIEEQRNRDWLLTKVFVRRPKGWGSLRKAEEKVVDVEDVVSLSGVGLTHGAETLVDRLHDLKPADIADVVHDLPLERRLAVAQEMSDELLADVLEELGDEAASHIVAGLEVGRAADLLEIMQPDDAADLIAELPTSAAAALLERMQPDDADDVRRLLSYERNTAGGLMTTDPIILPPEATVASALATARRRDIPAALSTLVFIVRPPLETPTGRLLGVVHLQRALREPPQSLLGALLDTDLDAIGPSDGIGKTTRLMATYNLTVVPVCDEESRLLGAISVDDVLDHLLPEDWREADEDVTDEVMDDAVEDRRNDD